MLSPIAIPFDFLPDKTARPGFLLCREYKNWRVMRPYFVAIQFDGCPELEVEANNLADAITAGKKAILAALYNGVDLWVARANEPGKAPGYLSEQTEVEWRPAQEIVKRFRNGNN